MKTCVYLRKSRKDQIYKTESIEATLRRHEEQLLELATRLSLNVISIKKEVVTGDSIAVRPIMQELLEEVADGLYEAVLVMDIDRLGRGDLQDQGMIFKVFKDSGVKIITPGKTYDLDDEYDEDQFDFSAFFARKELKMIKRRLQRGKQKSLEEGYYIGSTPPYGYRRNPNKRRELVVDENERPIIELIFDLYINHGMGDTRIARYLNEHGFKTRSGKEWDRTVIRKTVTNPIYGGKIAWNKREYDLTDCGTRTSRYRKFEDWNIYEGKHEAIVPYEYILRVWELSKLRYTPHIHVHAPLRNPLATLVKCGACGRTMTIRTAHGKKDALRCYKNCGGVASSYIYIVEERLIDDLENILRDFTVKYDYVAEEKDTANNIDALLNSDKQLDNEIAKLEKQRNRIYELVEDGTYTKETFLKRSRENAESIDNARLQKKHIAEELDRLNSDLEKYKNILPKYEYAYNILQKDYWNYDVESKNMFLREIIDKVVYYKAPGSTVYNFDLDISLKF